MRLINHRAMLVVLCFTFLGIHCTVYRLHDAAKEGNLETVKELIEKKTIKVDSFDANGLAPLHYAAKYGNKDVVDYLILNGADVNKKAGKRARGNTPLHYAAEQGNLDILKALVGRAANVNGRNNSRQTPLYYAVKNIRYDNVNYLLDRGATKSTTDKNEAKKITDTLEKGQKFVEAMRSLDLGEERRDEDKTKSDASWIYSKLAGKKR